MNNNNCYKFSQEDLTKHPIVKNYSDLISNKIIALPRGTWQKDEQVIVLLRYVLEVKLGLSKKEIPKIDRTVIKENKLWGALNRFKSIRKLIHFVYPGEFHECGFSRVPIN